MRILLPLAMLAFSLPAGADDYTDCEQYIDAHQSEDAEFDSKFRDHEERVLEPLRRQIANLDEQLGASAQTEKRIRKLEKRNREYDQDNHNARSKKAREETKVRNHQALIEEKRRQVQAAEANGDTRLANKRRKEISRLTKQIGELRGKIAQRDVNIAEREHKIAANRSEISQLEAELRRANADALLQRRRALDDRLQEQTEAWERARRLVDVTASAIELCESHEALRARLAEDED